MSRFTVKVKPGSKRTQVMAAEDGSLIVHLKSPPVDGKANEELLQVLAEYFGVRHYQVEIKSGQLSRQKIVEIL